MHRQTSWHLSPLCLPFAACFHVCFAWHQILTFDPFHTFVLLKLQTFFSFSIPWASNLTSATYETYINILWPWKLFTLPSFLPSFNPSFLPRLSRRLFPLLKMLVSCSDLQTWPRLNLKTHMFTISRNESATFLTSLSSLSSFHSLPSPLFPVHLTPRFFTYTSSLSVLFQCTLYISWPQNLTPAFSVCQGSPPLHLCFLHYSSQQNNFSLRKRQTQENVPFFFCLPTASAMQ